MANSFEINDNTDEAGIFVGVRLTNPMYLPDNVVEPCSRCFHMVQHRPDVAKHLKIICWECAGPEIIELFENDELNVRVTSHHRAEFLTYLKKKYGN